MNLAQQKLQKKWNRKQSQKVYRILNQTGKKNSFIVSTHHEPITLMLTKRKSVSGFVAQG